MMLVTENVRLDSERNHQVQSGSVCEDEINVVWVHGKKCRLNACWRLYVGGHSFEMKG